ncbi:MAG: DUF1552 domain-containing protein [Myxococcota bacterium]
MLAPSARLALDQTLASPIENKRWWFEDYKHGSVLDIPSADLGQARALGALADEGLVDRSRVILGLSSKISGGGHSNFHGALSCAKSVAGLPSAASIDAVVAGQVGNETPFRAVRLGVTDGSAAGGVDFGTMALGPGVPAGALVRPELAYDVLFGVVGSAGEFAHRTNILEGAQSSVRRFLDEFPSGPERAKAEAYLTSLETLAARQQVLEAKRNDLASVAPSVPTPVEENDLELFDQQIDIGLAALLGGLTNVLVVTMGTGYRFNMTYPSTQVRRHSIHHGSASSADLRAQIHDVTAHQIASVARLAGRLRQTPDVGGGTMLDHTAVLYLPETGEQHHSTASEFPSLLIGGESLGLTPGGRTLAYPGLGASGHRQLSNLMNTLGYLAGLELDEFGNETITRMAKGPLNELLA